MDWPTLISDIIGIIAIIGVIALVIYLYTRGATIRRVNYYARINGTPTFEQLRAVRKGKAVLPPRSQTIGIRDYS